MNSEKILKIATELSQEIGKDVLIRVEDLNTPLEFHGHPKPAKIPLTQEVFCGIDKYYISATVTKSGSFYFKDIDGALFFKDPLVDKYLPGTIDREHTADGHTWDEARELFRQGKLGIKGGNGIIRKSISFDEEWKNVIPSDECLFKLSDYCKMPEPELEPGKFDAFPQFEFCVIDWDSEPALFKRDSMGIHKIINCAPALKNFAGWGYEIGGMDWDVLKIVLDKYGNESADRADAGFGKSSPGLLQIKKRYWKIANARKQDGPGCGICYDGWLTVISDGSGNPDSYISPLQVIPISDFNCQVGVCYCPCDCPAGEPMMYPREQRKAAKRNCFDSPRDAITFLRECHEAYRIGEQDKPKPQKAAGHRYGIEWLPEVAK